MKSPASTARPESVAVIGAGIIGSWAALHLAEAGVATTLFDQFPLPHTRGSSHGLSRAFRFLGEHELGRLDYSLDRWQRLEARTGEALFVKTGLLNFGPPGDPDLTAFMDVLDQAGRPTAWLNGDEIAARFPDFSYPAEWGAAWDPNGGILLAHRCLQAVQSRFIELGGTVSTARVDDLETIGDEVVRVKFRHTATGEKLSDSFDGAVVAAGPWTARLLPVLGGLLKTIRTPVTYWSDPTDSYAASHGAPVIFNARLTGIYGLPSLEYPGKAKLLYHGGPEADPESRDSASFDDLIKIVGEYVRSQFPKLEGASPAIVETCMYTMTPDGYPVIDQLDDRIAVGCGFSGSGFKHAPATGRMLAASLLGEAIPEDFGAERYRLSRFAEYAADPARVGGPTGRTLADAGPPNP